MSLKVYYDLMSQPSRAVVIFLKSNKIPFVDCPIALRKGEHLTEQYTQINPFNKVPAIDDSGFKLTESAAILKYLAIKYKVAQHWYPDDLRSQIRVDEFMSWQHLNLRLTAALYFVNKIGLGQPADEKAAEMWKSKLNTCLSALEKNFLANSQFVNGFNEITLADVLCSCEIEQPIGAGLDILSERPVLKAYMERVSSKLSPHYEDAHKYIRIMQKKMSASASTPKASL